MLGSYMVGAIIPSLCAIEPKCKCGATCDYYGEFGGYSVSCKECNAKNAARQRKDRARRKMED